MTDEDNDAGSFRLVASNLPGRVHAGIPIAACRSGFTGLLNLEHARDLDAVRRAVELLAIERQGGRAVKLSSTREDASRELLAELPEGIDLVVFTSADLASVARLAPIARSAGKTVFVEVLSEDEARAAAELGADGLLAKGQEAGGRVGEETAFILFQRLVERFDLPIWIQGGIGVHSAAACLAGGAAGVVLDGQLALTREAAMPSHVRRAVEKMQGDETVVVGARLGSPFRMHSRPGSSAMAQLRELESRLFDTPLPEARRLWEEHLRERVDWSADVSRIWPLGQDAVSAAALSRDYGTVAGILGAIRESVRVHLQAARRLRPFDRQAPLARSHGTEYPVVQGPMTRVSDRAEFAAAVAEAGALPFLALAMSRATQVRTLLQETRDLLKERPWGVGILGFVPAELRQEQLEVVEELRPRFALLAGGRLDQVNHLESIGIATYLHVPSPALLRSFLDGGVRRFVFEGSECGGHVGPRTSFVLWESMIRVLADAVDQGVGAEDLHVLFAGGIHDARSSAMVAAMSAPLADRGVRVGVLMGTAYLFTAEAVASGAIVPGFQETALNCSRTILVETGPGHSIRCADTPFFKTFLEEEQKLARMGTSRDDMREHLERANLGRLRIASKGIQRIAVAGSAAPQYVMLDGPGQKAEGMYMLGQLASLRREPLTMAELHQEVCAGGSDFAASRSAVFEQDAARSASRLPSDRPCDVAIIGLGCLLPKAPGVDAFWSNLIGKVDAITEIPRDRFDHDLYFDADRKAPDKIYSKSGGFLSEIPFDPMRYGIPPNALSSIDPFQLLTLEVVRQALDDAGYLGRDIAHDRTAVILGASGGLGDLGLQYAIRSNLTMLLGADAARSYAALPEWTEDSFPGILLNVAAGRVANRFDLGGVNFTVDAACASSLSAVYLAVRELEMGTADLALAGGVDTVQSPFAFLCFSKTQALSPDGRCKTFDESADGTSISEGLAVMVLKRLRDAERDGDRIYAVIKGIAGSSDGRDKSLAAPRPEGQVRALNRTYEKAGFSPATVGLVEAHGTGTIAGDTAEVASLSRVFAAAGAGPRSCGLGSVKSSIGHTKAAAGAVGMMKIALALHHKVLPPTLHVKRPIAELRRKDSPFFPVTEATPWLRNAPDVPRRAAVSAFGFGGTNFHAVLEEYPADPRAFTDESVAAEWPSELFFWRGATAAEVERSLHSVEALLDRQPMPRLRDLAATVCGQASAASSSADRPSVMLAIVASSLDDLRSKLALAREALPLGDKDDPRGVYLAGSAGTQPVVAFLYPGQGSQYPGMTNGLTLRFGELRQAVERAGIGGFVFPPPSDDPNEERARMEALTDTAVAQPALGAVEVGLTRLLRRWGVEPAMTAGHSYGEYVALWAAGVIREADLMRISAERGRIIKESVADDPGAMAAVSADGASVTDALGGLPGVWLANFNAPRQTILSGRPGDLEEAARRLSAHGLQSTPVPVACGFHSPLVEGARQRLASALATIEFSTPEVDVFSNTLARPYPAEPERIRSVLSEHLVKPVQFVKEVEGMHDAGARIFLEVGPKRILTALASQILRDRPGVLTAAVDAPGRDGLEAMLHTLARLAVRGVPVRLGELFEGRVREGADVQDRVGVAAGASASVRFWINGGGIRRNADSATGVKAMTKKQEQPPQEATRSNGRPSDHQPEPPAAPAAPATFAPQEAEAVMLRFQELMGQFLQAQRDVMRAYLGAAGTQGTTLLEAQSFAPMIAPLPAVSVEPPAPVARRAAPADSVPARPAQDPEPPTAAAKVDLPHRFLQLVSERTGYPVDMLGLDLKIEGDLSIDSIKRVEVLTAFERESEPEVRTRLRAMMDRLTAAKTLREIQGLLAALGNGDAAAVEPRRPAEIAAPRRAVPEEVPVSRFVPEIADAPLEAGGAQKKKSPGRSS